MNDLKITISGVRGTRPGSLDDTVIKSAVHAFLDICPEGAIVVSYDGRATGPAIYEMVKEIVMKRGRDVKACGCIPLPTTQVAIQQTTSAGGICVSASHNPSEYNGLKLLNNKGEFISQEAVDEIQSKVASGYEGAPAATEGAISDIEADAIAWHMDAFDVAGAPPANLTVAVDANNASGSIIVPKFLEKLGCTVIPLATNQAKDFVHTPEPTPANLVWTQNELRDKTYDVCVVVDPDADRLTLIDEKGTLLSEECTLPLVVMHAIETGYTQPIVINKSTSMMTEQVARTAGVHVFRSAVGEKNVIEKMKDVGATVGGEGSGGMIDGRIHFGRDPLVGIFALVRMLATKQCTMSELVATLPPSHMKKEKYPVPVDGMDAVYEKVRETFIGATFDTEDGLWVGLESGWVHVRPSNTEPVMRVIAEASSEAAAQELVTKVETILSGF